MAGMPGIIVKITADVKDAIDGINRVEKAVGQPMGAFDKVGKVAIAAGAAIAGAFTLDRTIQFMKDAVSAASNLAESQSKVGQVFGNQAKAVEEWARSSATAFGQTQQQALEAAGTYGNLFQAFGLGTTAAREMSTTMVELAADLASFNNTSIDDAIEAIRSGLSGEAEPLKRYGVALQDTRMKQEALSLGIYDGVGALDAAQKAQAAYALILKDTTLAQGDFGRTSDGLANTMRIVDAAIGNAQAAIGEGLLKAIQSTSKAFGGPTGLAESIEYTGEVAGELTYGVGVLIDKLLDLANVQNDVENGNQGWLRRLQGTTLELFSGVLPGSRQLTDRLRVLVGAQREADETAADQAAALQQLTNTIGRYIPMVQQAARDNYSFVRSTGAASDRLTAMARAYGADISFMGGTLDEWKNRAKDAETSAAGTGKSIADLRGEFRDTFSESMRSRIVSLTESLASQLDTAKQKAADFASGMRNTILSGFGIGTAYEAALNEEGKLNADAWIKGVDQMVAKWEWFGNVLQAVRGAGNDPARQALAEYLAQEGADKGGVMGQALIDNGLIQTMADKMQTVRDQAAIVAQNMVPEYLTAGVDSAQATYDGFKAAAGKDGPVYKALMNLMDNLASAMKRETTITVTTINRQINQVIGSFGYQPRAMGGPVSAGRPYIVGEVGPELFVPGSSGSIVPNSALGGGNTYNISVSTGVGDPRMIGEQIVSYVKRFEQASGAVWAAA